MAKMICLKCGLALKSKVVTKQCSCKEPIKAEVTTKD